ESNNFSSAEECNSFLAFEPLSTFEVKQGEIKTSWSPQEKSNSKVRNSNDVSDAFKEFLAAFEPIPLDDVVDFNGIFGHVNFDAVQYFDTLELDATKRTIDVPDIKYNFYRFIISINHFKDELTILENIPEGEESQMDTFLQKIKNPTLSTFQFEQTGDVSSNWTDEEFKDLVKLGKHYCQVGDVFQIVFSRRFTQKFKGDDFQVYRALRSINPSPYLFYFDFGGYKIFGSSPEAQLILKDKVAKVNPIAGTFKRTGDLVEDQKLAEELKKDPKENAEHIMLVDLARNDLGRHTTNVRVRDLKSIKFYSHVIHMVSEVDGDLSPDYNPIRVFGDTFPAGTLSGAPKYRALELIHKHENCNRATYGGGIGFINLNGDLNHAIIIRSFLSQNNQLHFQAGAGVVVSSQEENELQEVNHKLGALKKALGIAEAL
ncbi:MAG: anthranilate synthase component I family protein, partial [Saprospiraceae bacterium]